VESCLADSDGGRLCAAMKRAILEVIKRKMDDKKARNGSECVELAYVMVFRYEQYSTIASSPSLR